MKEIILDSGHYIQIQDETHSSKHIDSVTTNSYREIDCSIVIDSKLNHYNMNYDYWQNIVKEIIQNDISYMPIGRLWKYTKKEYWDQYEEGDLLFKYKSSKSPGSSLSVDALYKTQALIEKLEQLTMYQPRRFPLHLPHHFEDIFLEPNGVKSWGDEIMCAVPKTEILIHTQNETETFLNK